MAERIRSTIEELLKCSDNQSAKYWAEKLVAIGNGQCVEDILMLAECYARLGQHSRVVHLLDDKYSMAVRWLPARLLAAQSLARDDRWEECLQLLRQPLVENQNDRNNDDEKVELLLQAKPLNVSRWFGRYECLLDVNNDARICSQVALWKGKAYEVAENRGLAARHYREALNLDPFCYEAYERIVERNLLARDVDAVLVDGVEQLESPNLDDQDEASASSSSSSPSS
jgi:anaphase-promoting complex subunit 6